MEGGVGVVFLSLPPGRSPGKKKKMVVCSAQDRRERCKSEADGTQKPDFFSRVLTLRTF
jgi:hypothetical protein